MTKLKLEVGRSYLIEGWRGRLERIAPLSNGDVSLTFLMLSGDKAGTSLQVQRSSVTLRADQTTPTCRCTAYHYPHHKGLGACKETT